MSPVTTALQEPQSEELTVTRVAADVWILRLLEPFDGVALIAFREVFGDALSGDVHDLVVDLGAIARVSVDGAATLGVAADVMRARAGALWIAAAWEGGAGYTLRPIYDPAPDGLAGISLALDDALDRVLESNARANSARLSVASRPTPDCYEVSRT